MITKALIGMAVVLMTGWALAGGAAAEEVEPCFDFEEALTTAIEGKPALAGGTLDVVIDRKAAYADAPITGLVVAVDDEVMPAGDAPPVGTELRVTIPVPDADSVEIAIGWQQGPSSIDPLACAGFDRARIDVHPSRKTLERYIALVARAQSSWNRHLRKRAACVEGLEQRNPDSLRAAARCIDRVRKRDRTLRMYRAITPPGVLQHAHRGLIASAALRATWERVAANTFRRVARFFERPSFYFAEPALPTGIQRNRVLWRRALTKEASTSGAAIPRVLRRVGTGGQL